MKLTYLVYVSSATHLMNNQEFEELLKQCSENNKRDEITGLLLHKDGNFMQYIEGPEEKVTKLYNRILADPRHKQVIPLLKGESETRQFGNWSMGFRNLNSLSATAPNSAPQPMEPLTEEHFGSNPNKAMQLLLSFQKSMR
ncbi:MAG TPA: BLUF domain-containing protein [Blastocatellia bacterium]|nr:BLUF domain-containing protein [Blastocatellia bacterium]